MSSPRDQRLGDYRALRERVRRKPEGFAAFPGELHGFFRDLYEAAARADGSSEGFAVALAELCGSLGLARWEDFVLPDQQRQFFRDGNDPLAQRVIAFWAALDEPLAF